jgi:hypothetical protein
MTTAAAAEPRIHELLLENLFAVFGERDPERRLEAIARNYTEEGIWTDPDGTTHGHEALNEGVPEQPPAVSGFDVALVRDGRIAVLHTLLTAQA